MHDSYTGSVSSALTAEENPAAHVSISPSQTLYCMKNSKQYESIPLNLPPTYILPDTPLVGNKEAGVRGTTALVLKRPRSSGLTLMVVLERRKLLTFTDLFLHTNISIIINLPCEESWDPALKCLGVNKGLFSKR